MSDRALSRSPNNNYVMNRIAEKKMSSLGYMRIDKEFVWNCYILIILLRYLGPDIALL